ncbi:MAG: NUDIX hydrolase [Chloroflexales bacterium]|nr:NUDIX hydrolase [Chloroflexales bacterium]
MIYAAGGVVYSYDPDGALKLLLIHDRHKAWTLPKGHLEPGEVDEIAAVREIAEETGVACEIEHLLTRVRYPIYRRGVWRDKEVAYFLARAPYTPPTPATDEGIVVAAWVAPATALRTLTYPQVRAVVEQALSVLQP